MDNIAIDCCKSCHIGKGVDKKILESQKLKYGGTYICKDCEETVEQIVKDNFGKKTKITGKKILITKKGIYSDGGLSSGDSLGFCGSFFLCRKKDKIWLTNNLWEERSLHEKLVPFFEHKINAVVNYVNSEEDLKKYLMNDDLNTLKKTDGYQMFLKNIKKK